MKVMMINKPVGPEGLELRDVPSPSPEAGEVLIRVHATAVNRADLLQCLGRYPAPKGAPSDIPGLEFAGEVMSLGQGVTQAQIGQRVMGLVGGGSFARYLVTHERTIIPVPNELSWIEAAAIPEAFITAHDALTQAGFDFSRSTSQQSVLVHAVGSGVGLAVAQIVSAFGGLVFATSRSSTKLEQAKQYGVVYPLNPESFSDQIQEITNNRGVDIVIDLVGGSYLTANLRSLALKGKLVCVGLVAGNETTLDLGVVLRKRLTIIGTVLRSRSLQEKIDVHQDFAKDILPLIKEGKIKPVIDQIRPLADAANALTDLSMNKNFGKIVLTINGT